MTEIKRELAVLIAHPRLPIARWIAGSAATKRLPRLGLRHQNLHIERTP